MKKKRHHYVWRNYLRAWATDEQIWCLRDGNIFQTNLMNIGQIKGFYDLKDLGESEIAFIRAIAIDHSPPHLQKLNEGWVKLFNNVFEIKKWCARNGIEGPEIDKLIKEAEANSGENLHTEIESRAIASIERLLKEDMTFLADENEFMEFVYFLCTQYFRTAQIKDSVCNEAPDKFQHITDNTWNVLAHIFATNVAWTIYANRAKVRIVMLKNHTSEPFMSGDQPVINTHAIGLEKKREVSELEFYYPISPTTALLITESENHPSMANISVNEEEVRRFNHGMIDLPHSQLYATSRRQLEEVHNRCLP